MPSRAADDNRRSHGQKAAAWHVNSAETAQTRVVSVDPNPGTVRIEIPKLPSLSASAKLVQVQVQTTFLDLDFKLGRIFGSLLRRGFAEPDTQESAETKPEETAGRVYSGEMSPRQGGAKSLAPPSSPYAHLYGWLYAPPEEFVVEIPSIEMLYPYQKEGIKFLLDRTSALLADDMGLGKTAQCAIALAVLLKTDRAHRVLVICPKAVVRQWREEARRWAGLDPWTVDGAQAKRKHTWLWPGVLLATPQVVLSDSRYLKGIQFDVVVCDDVSMLKNPGQTTTAIRNLERTRSWCLNGTPLENRPEDLVNMMEFVSPGLFSWQQQRRAPSRKELHDKIAPIFLRRLKTDHLQLPDKMHIGPLGIELSGEQLRAYREAEKAKWEALLESGTKITKIHAFSIIRALMQLCNFHPSSGESAKLELLSVQLDEALDPSQQEVKALVFSHSVETLKFLRSELKRFDPLVYEGSMSDNQRAAVLHAFKNEGRLLLMSTKAGARGLNLQHANYVFHFDRTWNPFDELQAEDRCWRPGQTRTVFTYRYCVLGSIEERIDVVLNRKRKIFDEYVDQIRRQPEESDHLAEAGWTIEDLIAILKPA